jgi:glycosyltransferase involved in cell wall biosynthesis
VRQGLATSMQRYSPANANSVVIAHPTNAPFVQHAARALQEAALLKSYVTSFAYQPEALSGRMLRGVLGLVMRDADRQLRRRSIDQVRPHHVFQHPLPEFLRLAATKGVGPITGDLTWEVTEKWFSSIVARKHLEGVSAAYSYENVAFDIFKAAKSRGMLCIYDVPIAHHATADRWVQHELDRYPELLTAYERHGRRLAPRRNMRKDAELQLADLIVVPSGFVRDSLIGAGISAERIAVVPFGAPPVDTSKRVEQNNRFVFLVAGQLSVRKGTHYVIRAWPALANRPGAELWLVGPWRLPSTLQTALSGRVRIVPPVPRSELFALFDQADVLVFPTLAEGLANTALEAMSRGLPLITTPNSGCDVFIESGHSGILIAPRDLDLLVAAMTWAVEHAHEIRLMGRRCAERMAQWQWADYRAMLGATVSQCIARRWPLPARRIFVNASYAQGKA